MIDNTGWNYIWKLTNGYPCSTNVLYTPTISPERDKMCMHYLIDTDYMKGSCVPRSEELINFFFKRELNFIELFQEKPWCPKLYDADIENKKILIEFNNESLNWPVYSTHRSLTEEFPNWKSDLFDVLKDINDSGYYKASIYPHCFFYAKNGQLKMIDYYATLPKNDTRIHKDLIEPIIGVDSEQRFLEVKDGDYYEMGAHFKNSLKTWIKWPDDVLPTIYDKIFASKGE